MALTTNSSHARQIAEIDQMFEDGAAEAAARRKLRADIAWVRQELALRDATISSLRTALADAHALAETQRQRIEDLECALLSAGVMA